MGKKNINTLANLENFLAFRLTFKKTKYNDKNTHTHTHTHTQKANTNTHEHAHTHNNIKVVPPPYPIHGVSEDNFVIKKISSNIFPSRL